MSDEDKPLEFSARDLMPDWAQETPSTPDKTFPKRFEREEGERDRRSGGGRREERRGGAGFAGGGPRGGGGRRSGGSGGGRDDHRGPRPQGRGPDRGGDRRGGGGDRRGGDRRGGGERDFRDRPREDMPAVGIAVAIEPSQSSVDGLAKHIKETLRAFPMADLAKMILNERQRYQVRFTAQEDHRLYRCPADGSVWLSREEAISHFLGSPAMEKYYFTEEVEVGAPTGNFTVVAVCGFSGSILGPPNHHEYQRNIARLHRERFSHLSLERYKSRIAMESGEEVIERWKEQVSRVRHYRLQSERVAPETAPETASETEEPAAAATAADSETEKSPGEATGEETGGNDAEIAAPDKIDEPGEAAATLEPEQPDAPVEESSAAEEITADEADAGTDDEAPAAPEPEAAAKPEGLVIRSDEELARHFRQHYADEAVREVREAVVPGDIPGKMLSPGLLAHLRREGEHLRRGFPLPLIQKLCRDLEKKGLRFFKRGKKSLHVSAVRPREIDPAVTLTAQIQDLVDFITANPRCTVAALLEAMSPDSRKPEPAEGTEPAEPDKGDEGEAAPETVEMTEETRTVLKNLRWLTSEGYVLEFPDTSLVIGRIPRKETGEAAGKSAPKKKKAKKKAAAGGATPSLEDTPEPAAAARSEEGEVSDSLDPLVALDAPEEDPHDVDALPVEVDPVETF